jgi:hypothetical protein
MRSKPQTSNDRCDRSRSEVQRWLSSGRSSGRGHTDSGSDETTGERQERAKTVKRAGLRDDAELQRLQAELVDARALNPSEDVPLERMPAAAEIMRGKLGADDQRQRIQHRRTARQHQEGSSANGAGAGGDSEHPPQPPSSDDVSPVRNSSAVVAVRNPHQTEQKRDRIRAWVAVADTEMQSTVRLVQACWRAKLARTEFQLMRSCAGSSVGTGG